eukprot:40265_1
MNNNCVTKLRSKLRIHRYFNSHTSNDITEGSFNCIGDDNYAIIYRFTNEQLCSNLIITITGNKEDESNDNINEVQILYRATNAFYVSHPLVYSPIMRVLSCFNA